MRLLDNQRKTTVMKKKDLKYIENYRKIYRKVTKEAKIRENDKHISNASNKSGAAWQVINKELGKSSISSKNIELNGGNNRISNPRIIAELFNSYFVEIVEKLADQNSKTHANYDTTNLKLHTCPATMLTNPVTENEVEKVIHNLKGKRSSGFDDVPDTIVKKCVHFIKKPLTDICNASFETGNFPDRFKMAIVKPLHKKGDLGDIQNYRPVSVLSVFSKILEKLMYSRLMTFIT
jgi:hypothetical protein